MAEKKQAEETEVVEVIEAEEVDIAEAEPVKDGITKLVHPDGRVAYAHDSMVAAYKSGGFKEV